MGPSNVSPFVGDVGQILLDDDLTLRGLWAGMHLPKAENGGGGSGMTSRRHRVSVVQLCRPAVIVFNAPGHDAQDESARPSVFYMPTCASSGLCLSDDDLADDFGALNIKHNPGPSSSSAHPPSQPSSLPIDAPMSRSPLALDRVSSYPINLNTPSTTSFASR